jgi:hypothetical protein
MTHDLRKWITLVEEFHGNIATVYHRTRDYRNVEKIEQSGFASGRGAMYGRGFYGCYDIKSQLRTRMSDIYGPYLIKAMVNVSGFLNFDTDDYGTILQRLTTDFGDNLPSNVVQALQSKPYFTSKTALAISKLPGFSVKYPGIIFTGRHDGKTLVCYRESRVRPIALATIGGHPQIYADDEYIDEYLGDIEWQPLFNPKLASKAETALRHYPAWANTRALQGLYRWYLHHHPEQQEVDYDTAMMALLADRPELVSRLPAPSIKLLQWMFNRNPTTIAYIRNPSREVQIAAFKAAAEGARDEDDNSVPLDDLVALIQRPDPVAVETGRRLYQKAASWDYE